jgi:hypothetical protein
MMILPEEIAAIRRHYSDHDTKFLFLLADLDDAPSRILSLLDEIDRLQSALTTAQEEMNHLLDCYAEYETICEKGELKASVLNLLKERDTAQEENKKLLSALISMCDQYIQEKDGRLFHYFMSAGEEATELLEDMGYLTCDNRENYSWTDKRQSALNGGKNG